MLTHLQGARRGPAGLAGQRAGSRMRTSFLARPSPASTPHSPWHLPDEEANIVPVMETTLTPKEVDWFGEHGRNATPKGKSMIQLGAILEAQPDGGTEWLHKHLPGPVRLIWRTVGARKYARYRAALVN